VGHTLLRHPALSTPSLYAYLALHMLDSHTPTLDDRQHYAQDPAPLRYKLSYMGEPITADGDPAPPTALLPRMLPRIQQKLIAAGLVFCPSARVADTLRLPDTADTDVDVLSLNAAATPRSASPAVASLDSAFAAAADVDTGTNDAPVAPPSLTIELPSALSPAIAPLRSVSLPALLRLHVGRHHSQLPKLGPRSTSRTRAAQASGHGARPSVSENQSCSVRSQLRGWWRRDVTLGAAELLRGCPEYHLMTDACAGTSA
jgi:hypothetical protein